jgi:hypothetical protein
VKQVKSVEGTRSISCTANATEVGISPASVYRILTNSVGKRKVCANWIPHVLNDDQRAMRVLATTHMQRWRNEGNALLDLILTVESWMHSFDPQLKRQNAKWRTPTSPRKKIARRRQGALKVMNVMFFSQNGFVLDHPVPIGTMVNGNTHMQETPKIRR